MLKVGVLGAGHLGKIHLKLLNQSSKYNLVGFYDADKENSEKVAAEFGYMAYNDLDQLIADVEVVDVVTPTLAHFDVAKKVISAKKHLFIENPMFIEAHRLAEFNPRGTDVPVVLDLMIHDIDAILSVVKSEVKSINASGVSVISDTPDIANARIEFENGCVANLTASRISMKNMRKSRFFQKDAYISVDFLEKKCEVVKMKDAPAQPDEFAMILQNAEGIKKQIYYDNPSVSPNNAILDELETFADAITNDTTPIVTLEQGAKALKIAKEVIANF